MNQLPPEPVDSASTAAPELLGGAPARVVVDLDAIAHNAEELRRRASGAAVLAVVKGDAYGHGLVPSARAALAGGATWLGVAQLREALALRAAGLDGPVLCWLHAPGSDFGAAIVADIDLGVPSAAHLREIAAAARRVGSCARVHLKLDTGMARNGAYGPMWPELVDAARIAHAAGEVRVVGLFSHLVASDEPEDPITDQQMDLLDAAETDCRAAGFDLEVTHIANSAGLLFWPRSHRSLVRPGLALYGLSPTPGLAVPDDLGLRPAMSVTANVVVTKRVPAGQGVSYNHTWTAPRETTLADIPIGYADGITRRASGVAPLLVAGHRTHVVGRVCMDQFVVDMGDHEVAAGDEAILFGRGADGIPGPSVQDWADAVGTISWEIVTQMSTRLPRVYIGALAKEFGL